MFKNIKKLVCLLLPLVVLMPKPVIAEPIEIVISKTIPQLISYYSEKYQVSEKLVGDIIKCETSNKFDPKMQSNIIYNFSSSKRGIVKGEREQSYGLVQIHLPDHPEVSYEQATDAEFSIDFLTKNIANGKASMWSCYRLVK